MPVELKVPAVGESITEVLIAEWLKAEGDAIREGEPVATIETDKVTVDLPAPASGKVGKLLKARGERAAVGEVIGYLQEDGSAAGAGKTPAAATPAKAQPSAPAAATPPKKPPEPAEPAEPAELAGPAGARKPSRPGPEAAPEKPAAAPPVKEPPAPPEKPAADTSAPKAAPAPPRPAPRPATAAGEGREEEVVPMSPLRRRVAARLVEAQQAAALLTTFNEVDMGAVQALRRDAQAAFQERHGVKLGIMSFFVKAAVEALKLVPQLNAEVRGENIVFRNYFDIGIAVGGGKGLVVPVLRNAERLSFAEIEAAIGDFARRAQEGKLALEELAGGTFTISNGGVYGSLLSTPIVNPPQSGILGLHAIQERPAARDGQVVIRPMMYVALTYDHRIVDGREAVTFLRRIKELVEEPARLLLEA